MKLLFCLGLILSISVGQAYDGCDDIRNEADCRSAPGVCYWNSSNVRIGHACIKFSGYCRDITTNVSTECTQAGNGLLCDWDDTIPGCVDKCSRLNYSACSSHGYCWGWNLTLDKCVSCTGLTNSDCNSSGHCVLEGGACKVGCGGLYPGDQSVRYNYNYLDTCYGNSSCYVYATAYDSSEYVYHGVCLNYPANGCAGIGNSSNEGQATCNYKGGNLNVECRWDTTAAGACVTAIIPTCNTITDKTICTDNSSCYWNSYRGECAVISGCSTVQTDSVADCNNSRVWITSPTSEFKNCTYISGIGCRTKCEDYISADGINNNTHRTTCNNRADCHWDITDVTSTTHVVGCKSFNNVCSTINNENACSNPTKSSCYWNSTNCLSFAHCSDIVTSVFCGTVGSRCKWNSTACVDNCVSIQNQYDCQDRPDCYWSGSCYASTGSTSIVNCSSYSHSSCPFDRCVPSTDGSELCLDRIFLPISDERGRGCSFYYDRASCLADSKCVYDNGRSQCLNFTSCGNITYSGFGGVFTYPRTDCNAKQGCIWENGNDDSTCGAAIGECVEDKGTTANCSNYRDSVACFGAGEGCVWRSGVCVKNQCNILDDSIWCGKNTSCQWLSNNTCRLNCGTLTTSTKCRENSNTNGCFWSGTACSWFVGQENCSDITTYDDCNLKGCEWFSTDPVNISIGSCFSRYEKANLIVRGCDDIQNEKQCNAYNGTGTCIYIWNADRGSGNCVHKGSLNCSWYKNPQQCNLNSTGYYGSCYWGKGKCQEFQSCENISVEDCDNAKNCGINPSQTITTCTTYYCSSRPFGICNGKCEWYKGRCTDLDSYTYPRTAMANANALTDFSSIVLGLTIPSNNPCSDWNGDRANCNANKIMCNKGCVYNSQLYDGSWNGNLNGCILFQNCSAIKHPLFLRPEIDCDSRIPCYWNNGECGETPPPSSGKIAKFPHTLIVSFLIALLWIFVL